MVGLCEIFRKKQQQTCAYQGVRNNIFPENFTFFDLVKCYNSFRKIVLHQILSAGFSVGTEL